MHRGEADEYDGSNARISRYVLLVFAAGEVNREI
jgi:hypothetical protein